MSRDTRARLPRLLAALVLAVTVIALTSTVAFAAVPEERISGNDRYETSAELAWRAYSGGASHVIIATGENWPDALAGGPLAGKVPGPILLTRRTSLPSACANTISLLGATHAYILGGSAAVDPAVEADLIAAGIGAGNITRLDGADRYETANLIAREIVMWDLLPVDAAYFATGDNFPDALAAGPFGAKWARPILLVQQDSIPQATQDAVTAQTLSDSYVLGETGVISDAVMNALPNPTRLGGANRYETARIVAEHGLAQGADDDHLYVTTGEAFPDALATTPLIWGGIGAPFPIIPVQQNSLPTASAQYINAHSSNITNLFVVGGTAAVSDTTKNDIQALLP
jgi:putative cell wall-binding protein